MKFIIQRTTEKIELGGLSSSIFEGYIEGQPDHKIFMLCSVMSDMPGNSSHILPEDIVSEVAPSHACKLFAASVRKLLKVN